MIFALMFGGVALTLPATQARVAGLATSKPKTDVRLAASSGVVVADITTQSATSEPGFVITSQVPAGGCFVDSLYTASPIVYLEFQNAASQYKDVQIVKDKQDFVANNDWQSLNSGDACGTSNNTEQIQVDLTDYFGSDLNGVSQMILYARFRDAGGNISAPAVSDAIYFGYPFVSTQHGDVHTNSDIIGAINGDASGTESSKVLCNPPLPSSNADYIVSITEGGTIQKITGVTAPCNRTFRTRATYSDGSQLIVHLPQPISLEGKVNFDDLQTKATLKCPADVPLNFTAQGTISESGCTRVSADMSNGEVVWLQSPNQGTAPVTTDIYNNAGLDSGGNPGASVPLPNMDANQSGQIMVFASEQNVNVTIQSDILYGSNTPTNFNSLNQLANFSVLNKFGDITIHKRVRQLAGTFFAQKGNISTSSQDASKNKLSIYGSLVAANINFNRSWLGIP